MRFERQSGILLHPTSLPGEHGIGQLGPDALRFVETLTDMGQSLWQVLPLSPTGFGNSPYQCTSSFAGNPLLISIDSLVEWGLVLPGEVPLLPEPCAQHIDFQKLIPRQTALLDTACDNFDRRASDSMLRSFEDFCEREASWLDDFALFAAIKRSRDLRPWYKWPEPLRTRDPSALKLAGETLARGVHHSRTRQFLFDACWRQVHTLCRNREIAVVGDVPIFVAHDSADVWAHPELFFLTPTGKLTVQAGVPPDYFSATGQLWGNPLYRWEEHEASGFAWWIERVRKTLTQVDIVRIDHFRGFAAHWEVSGRATTAKRGKWVKGPGARLFETLTGALGNLPVIAEDLGVITPDVETLRDRFKLPGMRILQFAFGNDPQAKDFRPTSFPRNCVVYTGTHDNDTTVGWFRSEPSKGSTRSAQELREERAAILEFFGTDGSEIHWDMIKAALGSKADTAIIPIQDILGLGSDARMNLPGARGGNWTWRFEWPMLTQAMMERLRRLTVEAKRPAC